jgi:hypothetical protein
MIKDRLYNKEIGQSVSRGCTTVIASGNGDWDLCTFPKLLFGKDGCVMS